jgi:hypothetical protein
MTCDEHRADFFGLLIPSTCTIETDIEEITQGLRDISIRFFVSETGCELEDRLNENRSYEYMAEYFSAGAVEILSGAIVYYHLNFW